MLFYTTAKNDKDLKEILQLQKRNLEASITTDESQKEGFVTVDHDFDLLAKMNVPFPHIIAKDEVVVGYALVMQRSFANDIPVLIPMFEQINSIDYNGKLLAQEKYFIMGQVCISKGYRGQGLFRGLYEKMRDEMSPHFKYVITEVSERNQRSLRAHLKVGFKDVKQYEADGEKWIILLWDWS